MIAHSRAGFCESGVLLATPLDLYDQFQDSLSAEEGTLPFEGLYLLKYLNPKGLAWALHSTTGNFKGRKHVGVRRTVQSSYGQDPEIRSTGEGMARI